MTAAARAAAVVLGGWLLVACNKSPALGALQQAEQALQASPEIAAYLPEEQAAITAVLKDARVAYDEGRYTDALRAALPLEDRIAAAARRAGSHQQELAGRWSALGSELTARIEAVVQRLGVLVAGGWIASERQAAAQAEIVAVNQAWEDAQKLASAGELAKAVAAAEAILPRVDAVGATLGLKRHPPAGTPAPSRTPQAPAARTQAPTPTPTPAATPSPTPAPTPTPPPEPPS
jgi:hypothetical protein